MAFPPSGLIIHKHKKVCSFFSLNNRGQNATACQLARLCVRCGTWPHCVRRSLLKDGRGLFALGLLTLSAEWTQRGPTGTGLSKYL